MELIVKILFFSFFLIALVEGVKNPCDYCNNTCVKETFGNTLKILRRMENKNSINTIKIEEEKTMDFNVDIAEGSATMFNIEITNLLEATVEKIEMTVNADKTKVSGVGTLFIPVLKTLSHGKAKFITKNNDKMSGIDNLKIPAEIDTEGKISATFKDISINFDIKFDIEKKGDNKVSLIPTSLSIEALCKNVNKVEYSFEPLDANSVKGAIEKAYLNVISRDKLDDYCETLIAGKEHHVDKEKLKNFEKRFRQVNFGDNC